MQLKGFVLGLAACASLPTLAQVSDDVVKIGVLNDLSGIYSDLSGQGSVTAARLAIEEMGGKVLGKPVELVFADHQNKPDVAANLARGWFDQGKVDMVTDFPTTSTALAVMEIAKQKNRVVMPSSGLATSILGEKCTPLTAQWTTNTYALAAGTARALVKEGKKSWYFITADYTFGHSLEKDASEVVKAEQGTVVGASRHPFPGSDFSSFLLKAQASKADVIALANAGNDTVNAIKQANEYGISRKQVVAPLLTYISDVHSIGLDKAQGMYLSEAFYWDYDEKSRAWARKFFERQKRMPTAAQAGVYSATLNYLKAVQAAGTDEAKAVMAKMKELPINDFMTKNGKVREDGRVIRDMYLMQAKTPEESKGEWDLVKMVATVPGNEAFRPLDQGDCPLVTKK